VAEYSRNGSANAGIGLRFASERRHKIIRISGGNNVRENKHFYVDYDMNGEFGRI